MVFDDVTVRDVLPAEVPATGPRGDWTCGACEGSYPVAEGWKVLYDTVPGVTVVAYVCATCATAARN